MLRTGCRILVLFTCLGLFGTLGFADEGASAPPAVVTLREAAHAGRVQAIGRDPTSYRQVELHLRNETDETLHVDLAGSYLVPRSGPPCQRLGIGPVVTPRDPVAPRPPRAEGGPPGTAIVVLAPRAEEVVRVHTCCLDAGRACPSKQTFGASPSKLPAVREKVLRWWADHPDVPQHAVNSAIWQFRDEVVVPEGEAATVVGWSGVAAHARTLYLLRHGELLARDEDGIERFLGTEIHAVHPTGSAVYAEAAAAPTRRGAARGRELWRLVPTGEERWRLVAPIPDNLVIHQLQVAPGGAILALTSLGLYRVDPEARAFRAVLETGQSANLSVQYQRGDRLVVTSRRPAEEGHYQGGVRVGQTMPVCELWSHDLRTGQSELARSYWNVRQIRGGPAGIYGLSPAGKLRRLVGGSFKNAPGQHDYEQILRVGRTCVWLLAADGRILATDRAGRLRFEDGPNVATVLDWDVDAQTDDLVYLDTRGFFRMDPQRGRREALDDPPARR